jgi:hypothetical protein
MLNRYALFEITVGPLPDDCENWHDPRLDELNTAIADLVMGWDTPGPSDPGISGQIRSLQRVTTDDELGFGDELHTHEWVLSALGHYVSTYCRHGRHGDECRGACKFAAEHVDDDGRCQCHCHQSDAG